MMTAKQLRLLEKNAARERQLILELNALARDIERSESTIITLQRELAGINEKFQGPRTTEQDVHYLSGLLGCAKKKLLWEKQIGSVRKRSQSLLEEMAELMNNAEVAPAEESKREMLAVLQKVQSAMERLQQANLK